MAGWKNLVNAAVLMSPAMQFDDPVSLQNSNFSHDVTKLGPEQSVGSESDQRARESFSADLPYGVPAR